MERKLIARGLLAGGIAGLLAFLFARIFAEPQIQKAIDYESGRDAAQDALDKAAGQPVPAEGMELFSRTVQSNVGIGVGIVAFGLAIGVFFAVAYSISYGRVGAVRARTLALLVALSGFLTLYLVPFLKYPANPPAIGHEDTIKARTGLYLVMVIASVVLGVLAIVAGRWLRTRYSTWTSTLLALGGFAVLIGVLMALLPTLGQLDPNPERFGNFATETPQPLRAPDGSIAFPGFPADVLFLFRFYSMGAQLILWGVIGLVFAPLAERLLEPHRRQAPVKEQSPQTPELAPTR